jgi:Glutathione S-transferase, N-terminal domain
VPTLVTIPFSHFCEKARWALDHARVSFREEGHPPGLHRRAVRRVRGTRLALASQRLDEAGKLLGVARAELGEQFVGAQDQPLRARVGARL